jgi:hypothetical protein
MTPLPLPTTRTWLRANYEAFTNWQLCIKLRIGSKQLALWVKCLGLTRVQKIKEKLYEI